MTYQVCPTVGAEKKTVLELWERNFPEATSGRYRWLYGSSRARSWTIHDERGYAIGSVGLMDRQFRVNNELVTAGQAIDLNVDQEHRSVGPALRLQRTVLEAARQRPLVFVYGVADRRSQLVLKRIGYRIVGPMRRWVKPLEAQTVLARRVSSPFLRRLLCPAVRLAVGCSFREVRHRQSRCQRLEVMDRFDDRFDRLWSEAAGRFPIIGTRTSEYLNWRFAEAPGALYRTLTLSDTDDRLQGYLCYHTTGGHGHIADFLYRRPEHLACLLAEFLKMARRFGLGTVVFEGLVPVEIERMLRGFGFWERPSHWPMMVHMEEDGPVARAEGDLLDKGRWMLTRADADTDL